MRLQLRSISIMLLLLRATLPGQSQDVEPSVIATAGESYDGEVELTWTLGEGFITDYLALGEGFHQAIDHDAVTPTHDYNLSFDIRPNPVHRYLIVEHIVERFNCRILDALGRVLYQNNLCSAGQIDVGLLPAGTYFIHVFAEGRFGTAPFVKMAD